MQRWRSWTERWIPDERGSASLEFLTAGTLLLVPMVYLIVALSALQSGVLAVEAAARQASRTYVEAGTVAEATQRAERAVAFALADHGMDAAAASIRIDCAPQPHACLNRRGVVTVTVEARVALPLVPAGLSVDTPLSIPVAASASQQVSRFAGLS